MIFLLFIFLAYYSYILTNVLPGSIPDPFHGFM